MTTAKRHIPINNHDPNAGASSAASAPSRATAAGTAGGATQAGAPRSVGAQDLAGAGPVTAGIEQHGAAEGEETEALIRERDTLADSVLRLRAEFENYRKRASRELVEARVRAQGELLSDLLPVLDNLERALDAAEHHEEGKVLDGVRLTRNLFVDLLARVGVQEIEGVGAEFDPEIHDAMLVQPSGQDEGLVATVLERGYRQGDRVLRPARVIVSAGRAGGGAGGESG